MLRIKRTQHLKKRGQGGYKTKASRPLGAKHLKGKRGEGKEKAKTIIERSGRFRRSLWHRQPKENKGKREDRKLRSPGAKSFKGNKRKKGRKKGGREGKG